MSTNAQHPCPTFEVGHFFSVATLTSAVPCAPAHRLVSGRRTLAFAPQCVFTYAGARRLRRATKLLLGYKEPSIFPVAHRLTADAASFGFLHALSVAPSGTTPCSTNRQKAIASLRASATIPTFRPRMPWLLHRVRHQRASSLCG